MVVDYERVLVALKAHIVSRSSHGKRDLLTKLAELEVEYQVQEGEEGFDPTPRHLRPVRSTPTVERPLDVGHG